MLNVRKISGTGVQKKSGGNCILSVGIESLQVTVTKEENSRITEKVIVKQKNDERVKETVEINEEESKIETGVGNHLKDKTELRLISLDEIAWHDTPDDCWFAIYDYVYDCTSFIRDHPGGDDVLLDYAGRDATLAFIGTGHSKFAQKILERYLIGELPPNERLFRIAGGVKVYGL